MITPEDILFLRRCLDLARMASRAVAPNPYVGAVVVHDGNMIGEGFHQRSGEPHAEVHAIHSVADPTLLPESTMYVSLEPCAHYGRTPPCADLIVRHRLKRVVIGMQDPNPKVDGGGIARLKANGVEVAVLPPNHELAQAFRDLNRVFLVNMRYKRPYITLKWAQTQDGFLAGIQQGQPFPIAITGAASRARVHSLRAQHQGILVGKRTASIDRPQLSTRHFPGPSPIRIVMDRHLTIPDEVHAQVAAETWIINERKQQTIENRKYLGFEPGTSLTHILTQLHATYGMCSILVEGGNKIHTAFLQQQLFDKIYRFVNPHYHLGDEGVPAPKVPLDISPTAVETVGRDLLTLYQPTQQATIDG